MKNVFLFGYYGFQNAGDEAILEAIIQQIKKVCPQSKITVLTYSAKDTEKKYGISTVSRNRFKEIIKVIKSSDIVISGGGSILQDVTSSRSLLYYLGIIYIAKKMGKKVMFYGNGFGPITRILNKKLVSYILNKVDIITVRDHPSKELMRSLGVKNNIEITADVTFSLEAPSEQQINKIAEQEEINWDGKWIGISVRNWKNEVEYKNIIAKTADYLAKQNYQIIFIPMQYPNDLEVSMEIAQKMESTPKILKNKYTSKEIIGIISKLDLLIGMRLHSLIFAALTGVPMVGIEYDAKISNFLRIVQQKNGGKVENLDIIYLWTMIDEVLKNRMQIKEQLITTKEYLVKKADMNAEIFTQFTKEGEY